ncbi:phosphotransferase family protein [Pontibacillus salicampi]|uniref:Phosphotransferase family protein n=1 Tax=Pontibacillus salicampi TaxID=1449801 RepID=A0ABV6LKR9_9BACI
MEDTIPVRKGEELDKAVLSEYLANQIPELRNHQLRIRQFGAGHSNLTYELEAGEWEAVLRRPPLGPVAPKAHDMKREYTILKALHSKFDPAPKPILLGEDSILGAPFFLMERKHGVVLDTEWPEGTRDTQRLGQAISEEMVDRLVQLHALSYEGTELEAMGKPEGFMERQVHGWIKRFNRALTDDVRSGQRLQQWLSEHIPTQAESTIIHYDYKLNNAMFDRNDYGKMIGLFDWEMTTVGDPMADLAVAMSYWMEPSDPSEIKTGLGKAPLTVESGFYSREEFLQRYAAKSGRDVEQIHVYLTFAYFKLAGIVQQIYYRYKNGQTNDERFRGMNHFVNHLLDYAEETAGL